MKKRQTHRGELGFLLEKLQHSGSSVCILHRVEQRWGYCIQLNKESWFSGKQGCRFTVYGQTKEAGLGKLGRSSLCWQAVGGGAESYGGHFLLILSMFTLGQVGKALPFPLIYLKGSLPFSRSMAMSTIHTDSRLTQGFLLSHTQHVSTFRGSFSKNVYQS